MKKYLFITFVSLTFLYGCEEEIHVTLPSSAQKIVIEGSIENGKYAQVIVTKNKPLFSTVNSASAADYIVQNAQVYVSNGIITDTLHLGVDSAASIPLLYIGSTLLGAPGQAYSLIVIVDGQKYSSYTTLPQPIALDSVYWKPQPGKDSLGLAWGHLTDPAGAGNAYRWTVRGPEKTVIFNGLPLLLNRRFIAPGYASFDDKFVDGKSFEFAYERPYSPEEESYYKNEPKIEKGYYKRKDTIYIKFSTMDHTAYQFYSTYDQAVGSNGNPFSSPVSILSNITGGALGVWAGFGVTYDTIMPPH